MGFEVICIWEHLLQAWRPNFSYFSNLFSRFIHDFEWDSLARSAWKMAEKAPLTAIRWDVILLLIIFVEGLHRQIAAVPWIDNFTNVLIFIGRHDFTPMLEVRVRILNIKHLNFGSIIYIYKWVWFSNSISGRSCEAYLLQHKQVHLHSL